MDEVGAEVGAVLPAVSVPGRSPTEDAVASVVDLDAGIVVGEPWLSASTTTVSADVYGGYMDEARAGIGAGLPPVVVPGCSSTEDAVAPVVDLDAGIVVGEPWLSASTTTVSADVYVGYMDGVGAEIGAGLLPVGV
ncbi:MAG: hypothetical protein WAS07_01385, partial [Micropruina sp.]